jgi:D-amino-acid dehydrogenase
MVAPPQLAQVAALSRRPTAFEKSLNMRRDPEVLVIGGGVVGLFSAYYLCLGGKDVTLLEQGPIGGPQSSSSGNTGYVGTSGSVPLAEPGVIRQGLRWLMNPESPFYIKPRLDYQLMLWLLRFRSACNEKQAQAGFRVLLEMKRKSLDIFRTLSDTNGFSTCFTDGGKLIAFNTPQGFEQGRRAAEMSLKNGVDLEILTAEQVRTLEPDAPFAVCGAIYNKEDAYLHVPEFTVQMGRMLETIGVDIQPSCTVFDFEAENGRITTVRTTIGDFRPKEVVIAAGTWSSTLARMLGYNLLLQPAKGYSITIKTPRNGPKLPVLLNEGRVALTPLGDTLRFAGTLELVGMDRSFSRRRLDGIMKTVQAYLPGLEQTEIVEIWNGLRPCTPDGIPFIGRIDSYRNATIACGHGHIGMGLAPITGKLVAQIIAGTTPDMDLTPFRVNRYRGRVF